MFKAYNVMILYIYIHVYIYIYTRIYIVYWLSPPIESNLKEGEKNQVFSLLCLPFLEHLESTSSCSITSCPRNKLNG